MKISEFFLKLVRKIFFIQNNLREENNPKKLSALNYSKHPMTKNKIVAGASINFSLELEKNKNTIKEEIKRLAKRYIENPSALLDIAAEKGAKTYFVKKADIRLGIIKEQEGFILPKKGIEGFYLNLIGPKKISNKSKAMFIFEDKDPDIYTILYNFYKWYSYEKGLPGFTGEYADKIKNLDELEKMNFDNLTYDEIIGLKQAIERDKDALDFATTVVQELKGAKNAYEVLKNNDNGASI